MTSCASTTVSYLTPKVHSVELNRNPVRNDLYLTSNADLSGLPVTYQPEFAQMISDSLTAEFNKSLANAVKQTKDFKSVSVSLYKENQHTGISLKTEMKITPHPNFFTAILTISTLSLFPHYIEFDYHLKCTFNKNGKDYYYEFDEKTSSWQGILVFGRDIVTEDRRTKKKVYENISKNLLLRLRKEKVI